MNIQAQLSAVWPVVLYVRSGRVLVKQAHLKRNWSLTDHIQCYSILQLSQEQR